MEVSSTTFHILQQPYRAGCLLRPIILKLRFLFTFLCLSHRLIKGVPKFRVDVVLVNRLDLSITKLAHILLLRNLLYWFKLERSFFGLTHQR